jgi:hypothetical protein
MPAVAGANCETPEAVWINLEVVSPLAGCNEPAVWIDITRDGCLTTAEAPRRFSAQFPDVAALKGLIEFVDALEAAAIDPATHRVAEVMP